MKSLRITDFLLLLLTVSWLTACSKRNDNGSFARVQLEEGDLVFRRGTGTKSRAVLHADSMGAYSHVGIVVKRVNGFSVIHITPGERQKGDTVDRVKTETLGEFWSNQKAVHGAVYRLSSRNAGHAASLQAIRLLRKGVLFDHDYRLNDTTRMYCTEFVWYAYGKAGTDISAGKRSRINMPVYGGIYLLPSDIYLNPEFKLIFSF